MKLSELKIKNNQTDSVRKKRNTPAINIINNYKEAHQGKNDSKVVANYQQSSSKVVAKPVANYQQSSSKVVAKSGSKKSEKDKSGSKVVAQLVAEVVANYQQSGSKVVAKINIQQLSGLQHNLLKVLYYSCRNKGQKQTEPFSIEYLKESLQTTSGTIKNAVHRLIKKGFISKYKFKNGRGGWTQYKLTESTYTAMIQSESDSKVVANYQQSGSKLVAQVVAQPVASISSSSSSINTTTTRTEKSLEIIQIPLNLKNLGFGIGHIKQLKEKFNLPLDQIQKNLESFAYDLDHGELERLKGRGVQNIIGYFFGAMKNGGYNSVKEGFVTAEEFAEQEMLKQLEKKKTEREERKKKLEELLFEEWLETKTRNELIEIEKPALNVMDSFHKAALKEYFVNNKIVEFQKGFQ